MISINKFLSRDNINTVINFLVQQFTEEDTIVVKRPKITDDVWNQLYDYMVLYIGINFICTKER